MINKKFERLTILSEDTERSNGNHKYYICKCDCGNIKSVRSDLLRSGRTKSCGCLNREMSSERFSKMPKDLSGQTINNLDVIKKDHSDKGVYYQCRCRLCGNTVILKANLIKKYNSCGCLSTSALTSSREQFARDRKRLMTNTGLVNKKDANSNSKTGVRGVYYRNGKYEAVIYFRKQRKYLGRYDTLAEASEVRRKAENIREDDLIDLLKFDEELNQCLMEKGLSE